MANETIPGEAAQQPTVAVDPVAVRRDFETAWKQGQRSDIRDYLNLVPAEQREELLCELLECEFSLRRQSHELLALDEYRERFPGWLAAVERQYSRFVKPHELEDYQILGLLGRGGMGVVYKARQVRLNRTVALKVLSERLLDDEQAVARFEREMQMNGQLSHPNIVNAHDARKERGIYFLVTEFVDGVCLSDIIKRDGRIAVADACEIVRQVAEGLEYARRQEVVHRDIKPSNLMLTPSGKVKILDFGLARLQAHHVEQHPRDLSVPGRAMGTLDYMAPEQYEDASSVDHRADIYSLGCTMFHLLVGHPPFGGPKYSSMIAKMRAHALTPTPNVSEFRDDVPPEVAGIVERMVAKHKFERFATPGEVADAVAPFAAGANLSRLVSDPERTEPDLSGSAPANTVTDSKRETQKQSTPSTSSPVQRTTSIIRISTARIRKHPRLTAAAAGFVLLATVWGILYRPRNAPIPFATAITTLPGLDNNDDGNWWFNEMPWLIPQSRQHLAQWARDHGATGDSELSELTRNLNSAATVDTNRMRMSLKTWASAPPPGDRGDPREIQSQGLVAADLEVEPKNTKKHLEQLDRVVEDMVCSRGGQPKPVSVECTRAAIEKLAAPDCHLLAVVLHKKATLAPAAAARDSGRDQLFELAELAYNKALQKYDKDDPMAMLGQSDLGVMYLDWGDQDHLAKAKLRFRWVGNAENTSPFSKVYGLVRYADACAQLKDDESTVVDALNAAERIARNQLPENHPLMAYVQERKGWAAMDYLHYDRAEQCFSFAATIRQKIGQELSEVAVHDEHGAALARQYRAIFSGSELSATERSRCLKDSHDAFAVVIKKSKKLVDENDSGSLRLSAQQLLNRFERIRNALDRDADGYLYGDHDYARAQAGYRECLAFLGKHWLDDGPKAIQAAITRCKLAMALACSEAADAAAAREVLTRADETSLTKSSDSLLFTSTIAHCVCDWREAQGNAAAETRTELVKKLAAQYAKKIKEQGRETPGLLRDEQLALDLLLLVTKDAALKAEALEQARKDAAEAKPEAGDGTTPGPT